MTSPSNDSSNPFALVMNVIAWLILIGMLLIYFSYEEDKRANPNQNPEGYLENGRNTLVLKENRNHHFVVTGKVNGHKVTLLLDTGATRVTVPADMAKKLGLIRGERGAVTTANGEAINYDTQIATLQLGNIILYDVEAGISPGMNGMGEVLLGMSALSQLEFTQRDGKLILTQ